MEPLTRPSRLISTVVGVLVFVSLHYIMCDACFVSSTTGSAGCTLMATVHRVIVSSTSRRGWVTVCEKKEKSNGGV